MNAKEKKCWAKKFSFKHFDRGNKKANEDGIG